MSTSLNSSHNNSGSNQINFVDNDSQQHNLNEYALAYNNVAAVYSQLDNFNYSGYPNQGHQSKSANSTTHARHNPYSRASTSSNNNNTSASSAAASNENSNVAAAILSYSVAAAAANPSNNYSAALYYHPYYSAHHYLHHPNSN